MYRTLVKRLRNKTKNSEDVRDVPPRVFTL